MAKPQIYIGIMSGTSLDGIDLVAADFSQSVKLLGKHSSSFPEKLKQQLEKLANGKHDSIETMIRADAAAGKCYAEAVKELLKKSGLDKHNIQAIGCHGQTIRHLPLKGTDNTQAYTLQLGDPNQITEMTGIDVVADLRRRDIAAGGEGAPLAPAFHKAVFSSDSVYRVVINTGGIANITTLEPGEAVRGFDTGPANRLMDIWAKEKLNKTFDENGDWAASAQADPELLKALLDEPYFKLSPPKSTGRELFNADWLTDKLKGFEHLKDAQVQATLLALTCETIANSIEQHAKNCEEVYICGGGAYNNALMLQLSERLSPRKLASSAELGVEPLEVEALAFAWLAKRTIDKMSGNEPSVTGAEGERILGAIYQA